MITKTELKQELPVLYNFLLDNNAVNAYITAVESDRDNYSIVNISNKSQYKWFTGIFLFCGTNEGKNYWMNLQKQWLKHLEALTS
jgi:hypothetical protein